MHRGFDGKVALITGAASGIGRATAQAFARAGAAVVLADTNAQAGEPLAAAIRNEGGSARFVAADVSKPAEVELLVAEAVSIYGRLDVAFNNAGIEGTQAPTAELPLEAWNRVIAVNLTGVFCCMQQEIKQMLKQGGGAIVNNASILGTVAFAGAAAYTSAKHGLLGLTRTAALEYANAGIRINAVCPGFIETPMLERANLLSDPALRQQIEALHPVGRLGRAEEVASAVLFLSSPEASFITGHPLLVDGGYVAR